MYCQPDVIVNCAALSLPRVCETDPTEAMDINVPSSVVKWLSNFGPTQGDQVRTSNNLGPCLISFRGFSLEYSYCNSCTYLFF